MFSADKKNYVVLKTVLYTLIVSQRGKSLSHPFKPYFFVVPLKMMGKYPVQFNQSCIAKQGLFTAHS